MAMMNEVVFILNGGKRKAESFRKAFHKYCANFDGFKLLVSDYPQHIFKLVHDALLDGTKVIVAVGGDGTLNECLNGIMRFNDAHGGELPVLGLIPLGSGNDFYRFTKGPSDLVSWLQYYRDTKPQKIDFGLVKGEKEKHYFINAFDVGLGGEVIENLGKLNHRIPSWLRYDYAILKTFLRYQNPWLTLTSNQFSLKQKCCVIVVSNGKYFGNGIGIAPDADMKDGFFDVVVVGDVSIWTYLKFLPKLKKGMKINHPEVNYFKTNVLEISGIALSEGDGEKSVPPDVSITLGQISMII